MTQPQVACPTCAKAVVWAKQSLDRPFCSPRCRLIDLGAWASEEHVIAGALVEDEPFSDELGV